MNTQNISKAERKQQEALKQEKAAKRFRRNVIIICAVFVVAFIIVLLFNSNLIYRSIAAVTINETKYSSVDFNFYYINEYNSIYDTLVDAVGEDYVSYYMPESGTSLKNQIYDAETGQTWEEFLTERTLNKMIRITALCDAAESAGYELSEEEIESADTEFWYLSYYAVYYYNTDIDTYLTYMYGDGMTEDIYKENYLHLLLASSYASYISESFEYTDSELENAYLENADNYDYISFKALLVYADAEEDASQEELDSAMNEAKEKATNLASQIYDEDSFSSVELNYIMENAEQYDSYTTGQTYVNQGSTIPSLFKDWLTDSERQYGDVEIFEYGNETASDSNGYYILMYVDRDNNHYDSANGYYIYVVPETVSTDDYDDTDEYDEAVAAADDDALTLANSILADWNDGLYSSYSELVSEYSADISDYGEINQISRHDVNSIVGEWYFDNSHDINDCDIVEGDGEYYILFYDGSDGLVSSLMADYDLRDEDYAVWEDDLSSGYSYDQSWTMRFTRKMTSLGG